MDFKEFKKLQQKHLTKLLDKHSTLFTVDVVKDELWDLYLDSFPPGTNEIYRERREFDCSCCRHYVKNFGRVVAVENNKLITMWDFETGSDIYQPVMDALSTFIKAAVIKDVFITNEAGFGSEYSRERLKDDSVHTWDHFHVKLPDNFISNSRDSVDTLKSKFRAVKQVFNRSLTEISRESVETVLDLISQKSLYKGEEWKGALTKFLTLHKEFNDLPEDKKDTYCWDASVKVGAALGKIKNHSIGVLLTDITEGIELNTAVKRYEAIVAPTNYKRPKAIFTKKMIEQAQCTIKDLGLLDSLGRRHASVDDITVNNILFANRDTMKVITGDVFDDLKKDAKVGKGNFDKVEEVSIETFVKDILPSVSEIEAYVENIHSPNFMTLVAPAEKTCKPLFKWSNNFSWAYNGNITDSMKDRIKSMGGKVDGVLRFSIQWNDNGDNNNDLDAHCIEPKGNEIFFSRKDNYQTKGNLDVDIQSPKTEIGNRTAVENITWPNKRLMEEGVYHFFVNNYSERGGKSGFSAEIEYGGEIYSFEYRQPMRTSEKITVAKIKFSRDKGIEFLESLPASIASKEVWNIKTQEFRPVSLCMFSPNYWDDQKGVGNKHYFFMLKDCKTEDRPNGFFNEFLRPDLSDHKRVFEALGSKMRVGDSDNQLCGLGFSSTQRNSLVCKLKGNFNRTVRLVF